MKWLAAGKVSGSNRTFLAIVFIGLFALAARNLTDPDLWWHLATGEYIAQHKSVPRTDPFSYTRAGERWVAHEWLSDLFLYDAERKTGSGGLIVIFAAVLCAAFFFLFLRCGRALYIAGVATLAGAWATMPVWGVRPQVLSLLLTSLWLLILEKSEENPRLLWWTLPLTLLWVNLHAGFALGLVLSALFIAGGWIEYSLGHSKSAKTFLRPAVLTLFFDLLLVPLNPNGLRMFWYPVETLRSPAMRSYIQEWASPDFHRPEYWPFLLLIVITLATLGWSRTHARPRDILLLVISLYAALVSIRMIPLFVLIAVPIIAKRVPEWPRSVVRARHSAFRTALNSGLCLAMAAFATVHVAAVIHSQPQVEMQRFPVRAVKFLQTHSLAGNIFNHYDWGGYLIWKLYPSHRVFIDGRADLYGENLLRQFAQTYQFEDNWGQTLKQWSIQAALVPRDSALATGLQASPDWAIAYQDDQAIVLILRSLPSDSNFGLRLSVSRYPPGKMSWQGSPANSYLGMRENYPPQGILQGIMW
ncbi:MAG: hypothetical protein WBX38_03650 [Candidatus Sulfotelmatobacter sp.]